MLTDLVVENFQSVEKAEIRLGQLTVVTGPSGAGKSALVRALQLAAFNRRGTAFIRHGTRTCKAAIGCEDEGWVVGIERGGRGKDAYRLARRPEDPLSSGVDVRTYTKLAGEAPEQVLRTHGLTELNFASQLDRPYLLDASGTEAARILGELTNVDLVLEAARQAWTRGQRAEQAARTSAEEAARLTVQVQQYAALPAQRASLDRAEALLGRARELEARQVRLDLMVTTARLQQTRRQIDEQRARKAAPPSLDRIGELAARRARLRVLAAEAADARWGSSGYEPLRDLAAQLAAQEQEAHQQVHELLVRAGTCPTCRLPVPR